MKLRHLVVRGLRPYRRELALVLLLQALQTTATLTLPGLNARLIDEGVLVGDNAEIWRVGAIMLAFSLAQVVFAVAAVWFCAR
ncbi:MAG: ABC transporter ATP-binding protein, partial [Ilumatobacter sp.]|nr:ABC transporter ATP-binding protein [Ilumatobacter sp.]